MSVVLSAYRALFSLEISDKMDVMRFDRIALSKCVLLFFLVILNLPIGGNGAVAVDWREIQLLELG